MTGMNELYRPRFSDAKSTAETTETNKEFRSPICFWVVLLQPKFYTNQANGIRNNLATIVKLAHRRRMVPKSAEVAPLSKETENGVEVNHGLPRAAEPQHASLLCVSLPLWFKSR